MWGTQGIMSRKESTDQECLCHGVIDDERAARPIGGPSEEFEADLVRAGAERIVCDWA